MILFIVTDTYERYLGDPGWYWTRNTLERCAGDACVMLHYKQASLELLRRLAPWAICHGGGATDYDQYDVLQAFRHRARPVYGTQFHPEQSQAPYLDGERILGNFFRLARAHAANA